MNTGNLGDAFVKIKAGESGGSVLEFEADEGDDYADLWRIQNAGDALLGFRTKVSGSWVEKLHITSTGLITNKGTWTNTYAYNDTTQCGYQTQNLSDTTNTYAALRLTAGSSSPATAQIASIRTGTGQNDLTFQLESSNTAFEALRITSGGNIRIPFIGNGTGLRQKIQFVTEANYFDEVAYIAMNRTAVSNAPSDMIFATGSVGSVAERLRITSAGEVLIGRTTKANDINKVVVHGTSPADNYDSQLYLEGSETNGNANTGGALAFGGHDGGTARNWANIYGMKENGNSNDRASYMSFHTRPAGGGVTERLRINSAGKLLVGTTSSNAPNGSVHIANAFLRLQAANQNSSNFSQQVGIEWSQESGSDVQVGKIVMRRDSWGGAPHNMDFYTRNYSNSVIRALILHYNQNASLTGSLTQNASDIRLKENIQPITNALEKVNSLSGFTFNWNQKGQDLGFTGEGHDDVQVGLSAQDVEKIQPEVVKPAPIDNDYKTIQYEKLVPLLLESIKELSTQVESLKEEITILKGNK